LLKTQAYGFFFPAAAIYAAIAVPLAVYVMTTDAAWPPGLIGPGHAHEMLFGFALAVVAGYLLGPMPRRLLVLTFSLWLVARFAYLAAPSSPAAIILSPAFALLLAGLVVPKFLTAKKWRNQMISPLLLAICVLPAGHALAMYLSQPATGYSLLLTAIILFALLMAFMGGRVIAPAVAGEFYRHGENLDARVQPRLEAALIILLAGAAISLVLPYGHWAAGIATSGAGIVAAIRLARWRLWRCMSRPDLIGLGLGYAWLALGLLLLGKSLFTGAYPGTSLHVITIGALGSLSIGIMARIHLQRIKQDPSRAPLVTAAIALIAIATLSRWAAYLDHGVQVPLLWAAAAGWSIAYLLLSVQLLSGPHRIAVT
jgi:uncharacterized protein involved in response to NO